MKQTRKPFKTESIAKLYFLILVNYIDQYNNGLQEQLEWNVRDNRNIYPYYSFVRASNGKNISFRDNREPDPESETIINMSEYILKLVQ